MAEPPKNGVRKVVFLTEVDLRIFVYETLPQILKNLPRKFREKMFNKNFSDFYKKSCRKFYSYHHHKLGNKKSNIPLFYKA